MRSVVARRWALRVLVAGTAAGAGLVLFAPVQPVAAEVSGASDCSSTTTGTINGEDAVSRSLTTGDAITVAKDSDAVVHMDTTVPITHYRIEVTFVANGSYTPVDTATTDMSRTDVIHVSDYAKWGVGLYQVDAVTTRPTGEGCRVSALINVDGNPITTVAGAAGVATLAVGVIGVGAAAVASVSPDVPATPSDPEPDYTPTSPDPDFTDKEWQQMTPQERSSVRLADTVFPPKWMGCCVASGVLALLLAPILLVLAGVMTVVPGAQPAPQPASPAAAPSRPRPRQSWRPRISIVGILGALLAAIGVLALLQQYGKLFPTGSIVARALIAGLVAGLVIPSLGRVVAVWRGNRRLAAAEARADAIRARVAAARQTAAQAPVPPPAPAAGAAPAPPAAGETMIDRPPPPAPAAATMITRPPALSLGPPAQGYAPTHTVPAGGLDAFSSPDASQPAVARLDAGLDVQVVDRSGDWARIVCSNGWSAWTDGGRLEAAPK